MQLRNSLYVFVSNFETRIVLHDGVTNKWDREIETTHCGNYKLEVKCS